MKHKDKFEPHRRHIPMRSCISQGCGLDSAIGDGDHGTRDRQDESTGECPARRARIFSP
jgi:hypothetical protein